MNNNKIYPTMDQNRANDSVNLLETSNISPQKCNLSFLFNFGDEEMEGENSFDSNAGALRINIAEVDDVREPLKRRQSAEIELTSVLNEMEEELERQLDAKAAKTNLTATNVKNILKHVITNEHVLAMVQNRLHNSDEGITFEPKLTRAKAKELALSQPNIPWPMTPIKKVASSEVLALIEADLPEDSSDEEYNPEQDKHSKDDARCLPAESDIQSQLSVVSEPILLNDGQPPDHINYDSDGIFKIPGIPHVLTEEESIGQRTRSKLSLSETPLEEIEQAFIPPDITVDMYDWGVGDGEEEWDKFLKEFTNPLTQDLAIEDDPDADPEYNILEDHELDLCAVDKEELRVDKAVKVSRKELNSLVAELYEFTEMFSKGQIPKKKKNVDETSSSIQSVSTNNIVANVMPTLAEPELPKVEDSAFRTLVTIQWQQHVQLMAQHFVMTYMHPKLHEDSQIIKDQLCSIKFPFEGSNVTFDIENLDEALKLVGEWEVKLEDPIFSDHYIEMVKEDYIKGTISMSKGVRYIPQFHPEIIKMFLESKALMYPQLLPDIPFRAELLNSKSNRTPYCSAETKLLALGLSEFLPICENSKSKFKGKKVKLADAAALISQHLMPCRKPCSIFHRIYSLLGSKTDNPVKNYLQTRIDVKTIHCFMVGYGMVAPKDQVLSSLSKVWQTFSKNYETRYKSAKTMVSYLARSTDHISIDHDLCTPIINMQSSSRKRKISEDEVDNVDNTSQPQLRKTTPRLAKTRSAQNMKLMTQVSNPKNVGSSSISVKSKGKNAQHRKTETSTGLAKGDNEDEIAELMLASTTIKKDTANRKKAKQARESENIKRMLEAESESGQEERATKFAGSYMQKLHMTLESTNPETLRAIINLYLEYNEKFEKLKDSDNRQKSDAECKGEDLPNPQDQLAINLYKDVCQILQDYPELCTDYILLLKPHQAEMVGKSVEHTMLQKMSDFINAAQVYFAKQPSRMAKVMQALTQLVSEPNATLEKVHTTIDPVLKGHPLIMDIFQQLLPADKPPDSLFATNSFENLTCPVLPHDKHRTYTEESPELYENIELSNPTTQDDPYGGDNCKCDCHDTTDPHLKSTSEHCISCGVRFLNGRVYLQTSEGLRPAKVTFPGDSEEQLENIARVSLKTTERAVPAPPATARRRKSSKNDIAPEDINQKPFSTKISPSKESEESDKATTKTKRGGKSPPKSVDHRKHSKISESTGPSGLSAPSSTTGGTSPLKSKREKRAERREAKAELKHLVTDFTKPSGIISPILSDPDEPISRSSRNDGNEEMNKPHESSDSDPNLSGEAAEISDIAISTDPEPVVAAVMWSRQDDALLLQNIKENYSEDTFVLVSEMLNRSVEEVKERFETLLALLEKMV